jgi:hypothetical protein
MRKLQFSGLLSCVIRTESDVSEWHIASMFRVHSADHFNFLLAYIMPDFLKAFCSVCHLFMPADSSTMKMEAIFSSESSGCLRTTRRYNIEERIPECNRRKNLISNLDVHGGHDEELYDRVVW